MSRHVLVVYDAACRALAECKSVDEAKSWADKAAAMQAYGRMSKDKTLESDAAEIRIRAERRLGEMLAESEMHKGGRPVAPETGSQKIPVIPVPTLADAGISKDLSARAQKLAAVPADTFESELAAKRERDRKDGARVSARLEAAGAKVLSKTAKQIEAERIAEEAHGDSDPLEMLQELQRENDELRALVAAASADDQKAETLKWRKCYDNAVREQSAAMDRAAGSVKREAFTKRQLMRCGKAVGCDDETKIAAAVEGFARRHRVAASALLVEHP